MTGVRPTSTAAAGSGRDRDGRPGTLARAVRSALSTLLVIGLLLTAYGLAPWDRRTELSALAQLAVWLVVIVAAVLWQIRAVLRSSHPWLRAVQGAVIGVALLIVPFAVSYQQLSAAGPEAFTQPLSRLDAFYFTVTIFTTVGFGDIAPVSGPARLLVTVQMLADLVLIGTIVKVLVGAAQRRREALGPRPPRGARR
jgi:hypothetical protein